MCLSCNSAGRLTHNQPMEIHSLYLDFDGPLHPNAAFINSSGAHLRPPFEYHELFENAPILDSLIGDAHCLQIIISSTWAMEFSLHECIRRLPPRIAARVKGATWCPEAIAHMGLDRQPMAPDDLQRAWRRASRYEQIHAHAEAFGITNWIALDDQGDRWPEEERVRLVLCDERDGLSSAVAQAEFSRAMDGLLNPALRRPTESA